MKDVGLRIRVQRDLREQDLKVCKEQDKSAAQVIREFMLCRKGRSGLHQYHNLPDPDELAEEIIENMEASLNSFREVLAGVQAVG